MLIAISGNTADLEKETGTLALGPQAALASAEKGDAARGLGRRQGLAIHVAQHQHRAGSGILNDGWDQAVHLLPIKGGQVQGRTSIPSARKSRRKLGMVISPE